MNKISKGEQKVADLLKGGRIKFSREYSFEDLMGKKRVPLRFDFALFDKYGKLICLLDVDGIQHFTYTPYFHKTYSSFLNAKERDRKKNRYCLMKRIPLIRIPYWALDNLTLKDILTNKDYLVQDMYHNDMLINKMEARR